MNGFGVANKGISFGLGAGIFPPLVFFLICLGLLFLILTKRLKGGGWWLILAGGLVNSLMRLFNGYVWDYWQIPVLGLWFNFADLLITLGVIWLVLI